MILRLGMILAALAFTSWWSSHTIFNPDRTAEVADAVLADAQFRGYLAGVMAPVIVAAVPDATGLADAAEASGAAGTADITPQPGTSGTAPGDAALQQRIADALGSQVARTGVERFLVDAHRTLIGVPTDGSAAAGPAGADDRSVTLDAATVDALVSAAIPGISAEQLAAIPPVNFEVPRAAAFLGPRRLLADRAWMFALGAATLVGIAFAVSTDRRGSVKTVGRWLVGISLTQLVVLYVLPVLVAPKVSDSPWVRLASNVARALGAGVISGLVVMVVAGVALVSIDLLFKPAGAPT